MLATSRRPCCKTGADVPDATLREHPGEPPEAGEVPGRASARLVALRLLPDPARDGNAGARAAGAGAWNVGAGGGRAQPEGGAGLASPQHLRARRTGLAGSRRRPSRAGAVSEDPDGPAQVFLDWMSLLVEGDGAGLRGRLEMLASALRPIEPHAEPEPPGGPQDFGAFLSAGLGSLAESSVMGRSTCRRWPRPSPRWSSVSGARRTTSGSCVQSGPNSPWRRGPWR